MCAENLASIQLHPGHWRQADGDENELKEASENWKLEIIKNLEPWPQSQWVARQAKVATIKCIALGKKAPCARWFSMASDNSKHP